MRLLAQKAVDKNWKAENNALFKSKRCATIGKKPQKPTGRKLSNQDIVKKWAANYEKSQTILLTGLIPCAESEISWNKAHIVDARVLSLWLDSLEHSPAINSPSSPDHNIDIADIDNMITQVIADLHASTKPRGVMPTTTTHDAGDKRRGALRLR